jgi:raffinose/stachyose/melibiose transport system substrate-binding protein
MTVDKSRILRPSVASSHLSRRRMLQQAAALGIAAPLAGHTGIVGAQDATPIGGDQEGTLTVWSLTGAGLNEELPQTAAARLTEAYPNVEMDLQALQNDPFKTKLRTSLGSDNPPDVWHSWGGGVLGEYAREGVVLDLTEALNQDGWKDRFIPGLLDIMKVDDSYYGVPIVANTVVFWYNTEFLGDISAPETWDDFIQLVKDVKADGLVPITLANQTKWPGAFYLNYLVLRINGPDFLDRVLAGEASFDDPGVVRAGEMIRELVDAGAFPEGFNGLDIDTGGSRKLLYAQQAAMELMGTWLPGTIDSEIDDFSQNLSFFSFPQVEGGEGDPSSLLGGVSPAYAVSQQTEIPEVAIQFLREITNDASRDLVVDAGRLAALKGATYDTETANQLATALEEAATVQLFWDQFFPPALGQAQLDVSQGLLSKSITPQEGAAQLEEAAASVREG